MSYEQDPLFPLPHRRPRMRTPAAKPTYVKARPVHRTMCDDCTELIHTLGPGVAPFPRPASWRRTHLGEARLLCALHKQQRIDRND